MNIKTMAAAIALGAVCAVTPNVVSAGGELQAYEQPYTGYSAYAGGGYGAYAQPMPANYARPVSQYYGGNGCGAGPCATMPYGSSYGRPGLFGNDVLSAGLLGVGLGYLIFH